MSDWAAVAKIVNERMGALDLTQRELATRSGVSVATLRKVQQGHNQRRSAVTLAAISRALGLPDNHLQAVANGDQDQPAGADLRAEVEQLKARVAALEAKLGLKDLAIHPPQ